MKKNEQAHILTDAIFELHNSGDLKIFRDRDFVEAAYLWTTPDQVWDLIEQNLEMIEIMSKHLWHTIYNAVHEDLLVKDKS